MSKEEKQAHKRAEEMDAQQEKVEQGVRTDSTPDHVIPSEKSWPIRVQDNTPGHLYDCDQCYGAQRWFDYEIVDRKGRPIKGDMKLSEHITDLENSAPGVITKIAKDRPLLGNNQFGDIVGWSSSEKLEGNYFNHGEQTFSVKLQGKEYYLTTKISQYIVRNSHGWTIQAVIIVP